MRRITGQLFIFFTISALLYPTIINFIQNEWRGWNIYWNFVILSFSLFSVVAILEIIFIGFKNSSIYELIFNFKNEEIRSDIFLYILIVLNLLRPLEIFIFLLPLVLKINIEKHLPLLDISTLHITIPLWAKCIVYFTLREFLDYWMHRIQHRFRPLWDLHQLHHSAQALNILTLYRVHPGDGLCIHFIRGIPLAMIGLGVNESIYFLVFEQFIHFLQHSRLPWSFGILGIYLIHPPLALRLHHSSLKENYDKNFGSITPLFDHLFGTWSGKFISLEKLGIENDKYGGRFFLIRILAPMKYFYYNLLGGSLREKGN